MWPEFDRFALFTLDEALAHVGKSLGALLAGISLAALSDASKSPALRARLAHL
jgi:hypothetical protein